MKTALRRRTLRAAILGAAIFGLVSLARAQMPGPGGSGGVTNQIGMGAGGGLGDSLAYGTQGDKQQRERYSAFQAILKEGDLKQRILKGREFLQRYPKSPFEEQVDWMLTESYRIQSDWTNEYHYADEALALNPKDVDVLATVAWTMAHLYQPNDAKGTEELAKAESNSKQALEVLAALPKPTGMTDEQFAAAKARRAAQAHSALGLVDFRRNDYENSAQELEQSPKDQTDNYVLGIDYAHLSRPAEAAKAFHACSATAGALQEACTKNAATADAQAENAKTH